jgi:predicted MPP superfamily phosphohydrolase
MRLFGRTLYDLGFDHVRRGQRFFTVRGVKREDDAVLVVSAGLGSSRIPLRLNCPPEIHLITLSRR